MVLCHCSDCKKSTGTGHSQTLGVPRQDVQWTGFEHLRSHDLTSATGNRVTACFCGVCGAPICKTYEQPRIDTFTVSGDIVAFHAGSIDPECSHVYQPDFRIRLNAKARWDNYC